MGLGPFSDAKTSQGGVSGHLWRPDQGHGEGPDQRKGGGGGAPQPQDPSRNLHTMEQGVELHSVRTSHMLMQMGQFIDHDITLIPEGGNTLMLI